MSYEGYSQNICLNGHKFETDACFWAESPKCTVCGEEIVFSNSVDQTNCEDWGIILADEEANRLDDEFDRLNKELDIENRLKEAGKRYFALSPRFHGGNWEKRTVFDIIFWLNPMDQRNNRSGWVTVEDILAWADGKGPIPEDGSRRKGDYAGSFTEHEHVQKGVFGKKKQ